MKILLMGLALVSSISFADDSSNYSDSCKIDLNGSVSISQSDIEFVKHDNSVYKIIDDRFLVINDKEVQLTEHQQELITQFSTDIRALIPKAKNVATDALDLASEGVNLVFNELLGENNTAVKDLSSHLEEINQEIEMSFSTNQTIHFNENGFVNHSLFGKEFEERIKSVVEQTIKNSFGSVIVAVGWELFFSGGEIEAFETRMDRFGKKIEHEMEVRSQRIEKKAHILCEDLMKIDTLEEVMRNEVSELAKFNMLSTLGKNQEKA